MMADMKPWNDKRLRLTLTRLGVEYLAALSLIGFFAVNSGNNLLYVVFSLMAGLFLVSGWVSRRAIEGFTLRSLEEGNLFARIKGGIRVEFLEAHPHRVRGLEVHLDLEHARAEPGFFGGGASEERSVLVTLQVLPERRGWCRARHLELRTRFPFGFLEKGWRFPLEQELLVLPHPRPAVQRGDAKGETRFFLPKPGCSSPEGARPFRTGDPLSQVHWKRTAQRGEPWIRTFEGEQPAGLRLRLDLRAWTPGAAFETELECLSGAILQARLHMQEVFLAILSLEGIREHSGPRECWRALALASAQGSLPIDGSRGPGNSQAFTPPKLAIP